jgi:hypothetical protein
MKTNTRLLRLITAHVVGLMCAVMAWATAGEQPRKVYADYHSARYTREHDGALGLWKFSTVGRNSRLPNPVVNRNGDLVDESGRHELPSPDYPLVGMQSELDPAYLEFQVLSAKLAHIDGFFVEWGYFDHASERIRQALTAVAARYDFEIGINLCDRWLFTQIQARRPELKTREQLVDEFTRNYRALLRTLDTERTAARFQRRPVLFLFGDGLAPEEFDRVNQAVSSDGAGAKVLIRPRLAGKVTGPTLTQGWDSAPWFEPERGFRSGVAGFFGWVPTRARTDGTGDLRRQFDRYGTVDDALDYLRLITAAPGSGPRVTSATPGFDNRHCAGWGNDFSLLERGDGELYRTMWEFNLANAQRIDWVFLPTWNDWTEGSQIEPSVEDQGLFLKLTAVAAAKFKGQMADPGLVLLPVRLLKLRQRLQRLARIEGREIPSATGLLDQAALALARRDREAAVVLDQVESLVGARERSLPPPERLVLVGDASGTLSPATSETAPTPAAATPVRFRLDENLAASLRASHYDAVLEFDFKPTKRGRLEIVADTDRAASPVGNFGVIADINILAAGDWRPARIRVFAANCAWQHRLAGGNDLEFRGAADVRNVRLTVDRFRPPL